MLYLKEKGSNDDPFSCLKKDLNSNVLNTRFNEINHIRSDILERIKKIFKLFLKKNALIV